MKGMNFMSQKRVTVSKKVLYLHPATIKANPNQPRRDFDKNAMLSLVDSIKENGIIQPLAVRRCGKNDYQLISGERRLRAALMLKLSVVPCVELEINNLKSCVMALIENIQRENLTCFEEADGIHKLVSEWGLTQQEASKKLGMAQSTVANKLRLLRLTSSQRERIENMQLTERHARALLRIYDIQQRDLVLNEIIVKGLNVEETDKYIDRILIPVQPAKKNHLIVRDIKLFINSINKAIDIMKTSGIDAKSEKSETEQFIKYTVIIPKNEISSAKNGKAI